MCEKLKDSKRDPLHLGGEGLELQCLNWLSSFVVTSLWILWWNHAILACERSPSPADSDISYLRTLSTSIATDAMGQLGQQ
jgi:hypothetical protein